MSPRELAGRIRYGLYTAVERQTYGRAPFHDADGFRRGLDAALRRNGAWQDVLQVRTPKAGFFAVAGESTACRRAFQTLYCNELERSREIAERIARHEIDFFGETFHFGPQINWHADPVTGAEWPRGYHRDVLARTASAGCGDIKYVWELNRHQFLVDLAKVAYLDRSGDRAATVEGLLDSWFDRVPYATGAPWACALEPAFRAWSWLWAYHMLRAADLVSPRMHLRWLHGFLEHGRFLYRHLEYYSSPFNHLVGEASALFALGLMFPEFREAGRWIRRGKRVLESTVGAQFHPDGGSVEQSTFYHHATLGFYILAAVLGRQQEVHLDQTVWSAIERAIEFSIALMLPDGRLPSIGGADDGKPIRLEHLPFWDFRPYYSIGAVLFRRRDFRAAAGRLWEDALWILGDGALQDFDALPAEPSFVSRRLPDSGYHVFRSDWSDTADYLCFDCGPQAAGLRIDDVPSAAHGHADCLSVIASLAGQRVLVDPGFYCYNGPSEWEVHFRRTAAHNTLTIDGEDQARHVSKMSWTHTYVPHLEGSSVDDALGWACGSHDGYAAAMGIVHRRTVWLRPGGYIVLVDELTGAAGRIARANYQFAPGTVDLAAANTALFADRFELSWFCSAPAAASLIQEAQFPSGGWIAPSLGVRVPAPRLLLEFPLHTPVVLVAILADRARAGNTRARRIGFERIERGRQGISATIAGAGWNDHMAVAIGGQSIAVPGIASDARIAVVRVGDDGVEDARRIGGTRLHVCHDELPRATAGPMLTEANG